MGIFSVTGTIRSIGQSDFNLAGHLYAYLEFVEADGRRISVQKVIVGNKVAPAIEVGTQGKFFFDKFRVMFMPRVQLWGVKTSDGMVGFSRNARLYVAAWHTVFGFLLTLFLGLGLPFFVLGVLQFMKLIGMAGAREQVFYGSDRAEAMRLRRQEAVRI